MIGSRALFAALLASVSLTACMDQLDDAALGEETSNLSTASWSIGNVADLAQENYGSPPAMVELNGLQYWVGSWQDGTNLTANHDLYWQRCDGRICDGPFSISNQQSLGRVSLAVFNGHIYMVHQGDSDSTAVWFSRFDLGTNTWTSNTKLSFTTYGGAPALAAFNGQLVMVGSTHVGNTYPLWYATMGTDETWTARGSVAGEESASPSSLAVFGSTLYLGHRWGQTAEIVLQQLSTNGSWSAVQHIPAGPGGANIQGNDVQLAVVNGYLHLIHHRFNDANDYWWTYNRGCDAFASEVTVPSYSHSTQASLSATSAGLRLSALEDHAVPYSGFTINYIYQAYFAAPPPPITRPICGIIGIGGVGVFGP